MNDEEIKRIVNEEIDRSLIRALKKNMLKSLWIIPLGVALGQGIFTTGMYMKDAKRNDTTVQWAERVELSQTQRGSKKHAIYGIWPTVTVKGDVINEQVKVYGLLGATLNVKGDTIKGYYNVQSGLVSRNTLEGYTLDGVDMYTDALGIAGNTIKTPTLEQGVVSNHLKNCNLRASALISAYNEKVSPGTVKGNRNRWKAQGLIYGGYNAILDRNTVEEASMEAGGIGISQNYLGSNSTFTGSVKTSGLVTSGLTDFNLGSSTEQLTQFRK